MSWRDLPSAEKLTEICSWTGEKLNSELDLAVKESGADNTFLLTHVWEALNNKYGVNFATKAATVVEFLSLAKISRIIETLGT